VLHDILEGGVSRELSLEGGENLIARQHLHCSGLHGFNNHEQNAPNETGVDLVDMSGSGSSQ
jgi:hypothetical protein